MKRVVIAAGGTGGHLFPGVAVAKVLRDQGHRVHFVVKKDRDSQSFLAREGFPSSAFYFEGIPRKLSGRILSFPFTAAAAYFSARRILHRENPDVVLGMGGYISVPVGLAAVGRGVRLVVHEQNVRAGLANRFLSRWAGAVATSFQSTERLSPRAGKILWTGLPLRDTLGSCDPEESRRSLGLDPNAFTLLLFGGSQGARRLNERFLEVVKILSREKPGWQYIHLTGQADEDVARRVYADLACKAHVQAFSSEMPTVYSAADFIVARSGANTVMEIQRMGRGALLVPFPHATDDHQTANARILEQTGQARVLKEQELSVENFLDVLRNLPERDVLRETNQKRLTLGMTDSGAAARRVAELVLEVK